MITLVAVAEWFVCLGDILFRRSPPLTSFLVNVTVVVVVVDVESDEEIPTWRTASEWPVNGQEVRIGNIVYRFID